MKTHEQEIIYRMIDANLNRAIEGLRVCEDVARFGLEDAVLTRAFKRVRHRLAQCGWRLLPPALIAQARAIETDVGRPTLAAERSRRHLGDVASANLQRAKESLRVLEEVSKLLHPHFGESFKQLRYDVYAIETRFSKRVAALRRP